MPTLLALIPGSSDLLIILIIVLLLFGNRLPTLMRSLGQGVPQPESRCPHCGWRIHREYRCPHCGRIKFPQVISKTPVEPRDDSKYKQSGIPFPRWLVALLAITGVAWAADWIGSSLAGLSSNVIWHSWWHWATLSLIVAALVSLASYAVIAQYANERNGPDED